VATPKQTHIMHSFIVDLWPDIYSYVFMNVYWVPFSQNKLCWNILL